MRPTLSEMVEAGLTDERLQFLALLRRVHQHDWGLVARTALTAGSMARLLEDGLWDTPGAVRSPLGPLDALPMGWSGTQAAVQKELELAEEAGSRFVTVFDDQFPLNLRRASRTYPFLSYDGTLDADRDAHSVYVASGRRAPSAEDLRRARIIGRGLARRGVTVIGDVLSEIDRTVLQTALDVGGRAVAALLYSLGPVRYGYRGQRQLCEDIIASGGAVVCANWPSDRPNQFTFRPSNGLKMTIASGAVVVERPPPYGARREARGAVRERRPVFFVGPVTVEEIDVGDDPWDTAELAPISYVVYNGAQIARRLRSFYATTEAGAAKHSPMPWQVERLRQRAAGLVTGVAPRTRFQQTRSLLRARCTPPAWLREWLAEPAQRLTRPSSSATETAVEALRLQEARRRSAAEDERYRFTWRGETVELKARRRGTGPNPLQDPVINEGYWVLAHGERPRRRRSPKRRLFSARRPLAEADPDRTEWLEMLLAPLNAGMIEVEELPQIDRDLQAIADADKVCFADVSSNNAAAVAMACAHWTDPKGAEWLLWALSARLEDNLDPEVGRGEGPGLLAWSYYYKLDNRGFGRDASWTTQMPPAFWRRLTNHPDPSLRRAVIASDPQALGRDLARLVDESGISGEIADMIASNPRTPPAAQLQLVTRSHPSRTAGRMGQNRRTSRRLLARLARSPEWMVRDVVAVHRRAPRRALTRLAKDCKAIRQATAGNPRTPKRTLRGLAADPEPHVRIAAASNEAIPADVLATLLQDGHERVREHAANNPRAS
ncbi:MAG: hypothetical protein F4X11_16060 [Acidobacteria bacterium]|nr:DNA-processing protein DprA [Acidimicrobiaceae bacterium]MYN66521.1 hypothetical protein [Acidobacteriota bacterium]